MSHLLTKLLVKKILESPLGAGRWTLQGFGMLRLYLDKEVRLSVWDARYQYKPRPSMIHDHPWSFESVIVAGVLTNNKFLRQLRTDSFPPRNGCEPFMERVIVPGHGLRQHLDDVPVWLDRQIIDEYKEGQTYRQAWNEIHETTYADGTVTIITRNRGERPDLAKTFWREEDGWQTAEPREASETEVQDICSHSLRLWF